MDQTTNKQKSKNDVQHRDVTIIGAGPVGLFAIFQCGMMGLSCNVIDSLDEIGGQCTALYPQKPIYDIPAFPVIEAGILIQNLEDQAKPFKPNYHLGAQVVSIRDNEAIWEIVTSNGFTFTSKAIIIAAGAGAFGPNRPPLKDIEKYENQSVFYFIKDKSKFKNKNIVIAGGGDSAVDWAIGLSEIAKSVHLVHRRDKFRALPENIEKLHHLVKANKINLLTPYQLNELEGDNGQLYNVIIKDKQSNLKKIETDFLLPFYGLSTDLGPINNWNLAIEKGEILVNPTTAQTNINNIYAIGDIATYKYKKKFILTGFSEAAFAAQHIFATLYPHKVQHFEYSTTKGIPKN